MIIKPKIRGFICTTAHPAGCAANVREQARFVQGNGTLNGPRRVLVIGASNGYGLASRIVSAFACGADTLGVFFEKEPTPDRCASAGWYNSAALHGMARELGLYADGINGDAFSDEIKERVISTIKDKMQQVDLVVYSLGAPRRTDPQSGITHKSTLKPIGAPVTCKNLNTDSGKISDITLEAASDEEIASTVKVMGGEDWERWINAMLRAGVLADGCQTVSYTYIGKNITRAIYGDATIGRAKDDLQRAATSIQDKMKSINGRARLAVLKGLVTQSSSAIPVMPLYIALLYRVMKDRGVHEGCIEQIDGLFRQCLYGDGGHLDEAGRWRMDGKELDDAVQSEVERLWEQVDTASLDRLSDYAGYQREFLKLFGFGYADIDYDADIDPLVPL